MRELNPNQCHTRVAGSLFRAYQCSRPVKIVRDGLNYCTIHDPEYIKAKREAKQKESDAKWARQEAEYTLAAAQHRATSGLTLDELSRVTPELIREALARK